MENNNLFVLIAVILMGTMAVSMIVTNEVTQTSENKVQLNAPFPAHSRSDLGLKYSPN